MQGSNGTGTEGMLKETELRRLDYSDGLLSYRIFFSMQPIWGLRDAAKLELQLPRLVWSLLESVSISWCLLKTIWETLIAYF